MSLSKRINGVKCRRCLTCVIRKYSSETNANRQFSRVFTDYFKSMSISQWRLISQIKEQLNEKNVMHIVRREWVDLVKKLPAIPGIGQTTATQSQDLSTKSSESSRTGQVLLESIQLLNDLRAKLSQSSTLPPSSSLPESKWKKKGNAVSAESIASRTNQLIAGLETAKSKESTLKRLDDFTKHLLEYPQASGLAVKKGAIRVLLRARSEAEGELVSESAQAALAMVGYADPPGGRGIRILAIDGGGVRGLLVIEMLRRLEELTDKKIHQLFDYICGVSTGSILAATIGAKGSSLDEISQLYKILSTKIFTQNAFEGARSLLWSHGYYDTAQWEQILQEHVGDLTFHESAKKRWCPKIGAVSTVVHEGQVVPFVFRNYEHPYRVRSQYVGSNRYKLWEATRASAAAPAIFGEFRLGPFLHQDGGMLVNNPAAVALHEAKLLWPRHKVQCVVSCGTGRVNPNASHNKDDTQLIKTSSWKETFTQVLVSATDTEAVHTILSDLLPSTKYFRFNPYLTEMLSMVEFQPEKLALLEQDAAMYIRRNDEKFAEAAQSLSAPKPWLDKCGDWLALKSATYQPF